MARRCMHGYVSGQVQGVGFRQHTVAEAERLDLDGWVRNLADGRVEVLFEGDGEAVDSLVAWLAHGPTSADVSTVELTEQPLQGIVGFVLRR